ncbi:hypothetical protein MBAV_000783, partial [Candidatus Magnetobacterium bavaricum]
MKAALGCSGVFGSKKIKPESGRDDIIDDDGCAERHPVTKTIEALIKNHTDNKRQKTNRHKAKYSVDRQIEAIKLAMSEDNNKKFERYLYDVSDYNLNHGGKKYLAMTYCNIAKYAMDIHKGAFAERLLDYAALLNVRDVVILTSRAEFFKFKGLLEDALTAYDAAIEAFPNYVIAQCGRAELLRELDRLEDALTAYDAAIEAFPNY